MLWKTLKFLYGQRLLKSDCFQDLRTLWAAVQIKSVCISTSEAHPFLKSWMQWGPSLKALASELWLLAGFPCGW